MSLVVTTHLVPQMHAIWQLDAELGASRGSPLPSSQESLLLLADMWGVLSWLGIRLDCSSLGRHPGRRVDGHNLPRVRRLESAGSSLGLPGCVRLCLELGTQVDDSCLGWGWSAVR